MTAASPCYRCLYSDEDENLANCAGQGVLAPVAGTIGTLLATEALKLLLGLESGLRNRLWIYDGLSGDHAHGGHPQGAGLPRLCHRRSGFSRDRSP